MPPMQAILKHALAACLRHIGFKLARDVGLRDGFSAVQAIKNVVDYFLRLEPLPGKDEAVKHMIASERSANFKLTLMLPEFGEVHHAEFAGVFSITVNFKHHALLIALASHR